MQNNNPATAKQPAPEPGQNVILDLVLADLVDAPEHVRGPLEKGLRERAAAGLETYGTPLMSHNGRDALADAFQEQLDAVMYLRQWCAEYPENIAAGLIYWEAVAVALNLCDQIEQRNKDGRQE